MCRGPQVVSQGVSVNSGILWCLEGPLGTPLGSVQWKRASSPVEVETSGFLSISDSDRRSLQSWDMRGRPRLVLRHGTPLATQVILGVTGHLSSCIWNLWVLRTTHGGVSAPSCCDFIHRVAFEEVSGHRVLIKSGPRNQGPSEGVTTHETTSRISS